MRILNGLPQEKIAGNAKPQNRSTQGIMLLECLVYAGLLFLFLGLAFSLFYVCWDDSRGLRRNADDVVRTLKAGERWREDVRMATGALQVEGFENGQLVRIPQKTGQVVYRFADGGVVQRKANDRAEWMTVLSRVKSSRMRLDKRQQVTSWNWEVELKTFQKSVHTRPLFSFHAVPPKTQ